MTAELPSPLARLRELVAALPDAEARQAIEALLTGPFQAPRRPMDVSRLALSDAPWVEEAWALVGPALVTCAHTASPDGALLLFLAVRYAPHPSVIGELGAFAKGDLPADTRAAALEAIGEIDDAGAAEAARACLASAEPSVRAAAARALGRLARHCHAADAASLRDLLETDPSPDVQQWAAVAVGELAGAGFGDVDVLWRKLDAAVDVYPEVLTGAAIGLSGAVDGQHAEAVVGGLLQRIEDARVPVQRAALEAIALVPVDSIPVPLRWRAKKAIGAIAGEPVANSRVAAWAMARRGDPAGRAYLVLAAQQGGLEAFEAEVFLAELSSNAGIFRSQGA